MIKKTLLTLCFSLFLINPTHAETELLAPEQQRPPIKIVTSFTILADMVDAIGGDKVDVVSLLKIGEEVHGFEPAASDAIKLKEAEIIAINGLSFEGWMHKLISASQTKADLLVASAGVNALWIQEGREHTPDPHAWVSVKNAQRYAKNIAAALIKVRPEWEEEIKMNATSYIIELQALDKKARLSFALIPSAKRKLIMNHDAFSYLARDYSIETEALSGLSHHDEASAKDIKKIIQFIKDKGIKTIFAEELSSPRTLKTIAQESGAKIGKTLYAGSLTNANGEAPTYLKMMELNINRIFQSMSH